MDYSEDDSTDELIDTFCVGCDLPFHVKACVILVLRSWNVT